MRGFLLSKSKDGKALRAVRARSTFVNLCLTEFSLCLSRCQQFGTSCGSLVCTCLKAPAISRYFHGSSSLDLSVDHESAFKNVAKEVRDSTFSVQTWVECVAHASIDSFWYRLLKKRFPVRSFHHARHWQFRKKAAQQVAQALSDNAFSVIGSEWFEIESCLSFPSCTRISLQQTIFKRPYIYGHQQRWWLPQSFNRPPISAGLDCQGGRPSGTLWVVLGGAR